MKTILSYLAVAGASVLIVYAWDGGNWRWQSNNIVITPGITERLATRFRQTWQRSPVGEERDRLIEEFVREEIAYREGIARNLGANDVPLRRRLQSILEELARQSAASTEPTQQQLQAWLDDNEAAFRVGNQVTLRHVFFQNAANSIASDATARFMLGRLQNQEMPDDISDYGDPSPIPNDLFEAGENEIAALLGAGFLAEIQQLPARRWAGPVASDLGLHLVYVVQRTAGQKPQLSAVEDAVRRAWLNEQQRQAVDTMYQALRQNYDVTTAAGAWSGEENE